MRKILGMALAGFLATTIVATPAIGETIPCPPGGCAKAGDPNDTRPRGGNAPNGKPGAAHDEAQKPERYEDGTSGPKTWTVVGVDANGNDVMLGRTNEGNVYTWHFNTDLGKWHLEMGDLTARYLD